MCAEWRWNGVVLNINATCIELGPECLQLLGMHALKIVGVTLSPIHVFKDDRKSYAHHGLASYRNEPVYCKAEGKTCSIEH